MKLYKVVWTIEIAAETREAAVNEAVEIQRDIDSTANCFEVTDTEDKTDCKLVYY